MILRKLYIYLVLIAILAISPLTVFSAGTPDVNTLKQEIVVKNAITEGDALYVVHYDIDYTVLPTEPMHQLYSGILISQNTSSGVTALEGQSFPFYEDIQPKDGFGQGIWGIYVSTEPTITSDEELKLCNEPNDTTGPPGTRTCSTLGTSYYDGNVDTDVRNFQAKIAELIEDLEENWDTTSAPIDLITDIAGSKRLTNDGDDYLVHSIPNIRSLIPNIFVSGLLAPNIILDEERDETYETSRANYFQGTELDTSDGSGSALDLIGNVVGLDNNPQLVGTAMVLLAGMAIAFFVIQATQNTSVGIFCVILVLQVGAFLGLVSFAVTAVLALIGALALGYIFFYKSSTS